MTGSRVLERTRIALTTGQWWTIPWWRADQYYDDGLITRDEVEAAFDQLKETYDAGWMIEERDAVIAKARKWFKEHQQGVGQDHRLLGLKEKLNSSSEPSEAYSVCQSIGFYPTHPLFNEFLLEGSSPFQYLLNLGLSLLAAKEVDLLWKGLVKRLKNGNEYSGAHFELEFLGHLLRGDCSVETEPPSGVGEKKADLKIFKGSETLFVELKRLQPSRINLSVSHISNLIFHYVVCDRLVASSPNIMSLELSAELRAKAETEAGRNELFSSWQVIAEQIKKHIMERIQCKKWGHHIVPGLAEYDLSPKEGSGIGGCFAGFSLSSESESNRIFRNAIADALEQLPVGGPGIVIVQPSFPLDPNAFQHIALSKFEKYRQKYQHLSAIILVYIFSRDYRIRYQLDVIENPYATHDVSTCVIMKDILLLGNQ